MFKETDEIVGNCSEFILVVFFSDSYISDLFKNSN